MSLAEKLHEIKGSGPIGVGLGAGLGLFTERMINKAADIGTHLRYPIWDATIGVGFAGGITDHPGWGAGIAALLNYRPIFGAANEVITGCGSDNLEELGYKALAFGVAYGVGWAIGKIGGKTK